MKDMNGSDCSITIKEISREEFVELKSSFKLNLFTEPLWVDAFKNDNIAPIYFAFLKDKQTVGVTGGIVVRSRHKILQPISKYIFFFGMPEIQDDGSLIIIGEFKRYLRENGFNVLKIAGTYNVENHCLKKWGFVPTHKTEYIVDLLPALPEIWRKLNKGAKWTVNKAKKAGLQFNESNSAEKLEDLITCLKQTKYRKSNKGFGDYEYLYIPFLDNEVLVQLLKSENVSICYISHNNRTVSASLVVTNNCQVYYALAGSTKEGYEMGASSYLVWKIIERKKEAGCESLNLGALPSDGSAATLAQFKHSFGADEKLCEGGTCYFIRGPRKLLYKSYKFMLKPSFYLAYALKLLKKRLSIRQGSPL